MNFVTRFDHLTGYKRMNGPICGTNRHRSDSDTSQFIEKSISWKWHKGSRVSTLHDWLQIRIGGDSDNDVTYTANESHMKNKRKMRKQEKTNRIKSTKYTFVTFLPQNLLEQFRRIANFYFLIMTIISLIIDSPVSPMTSLLPLVFVIAVTSAKQGYEDFLRYKTDNIVNCSPVTVIRNGMEESIQSQYIQPGDLVVVERDCDVPCDLVLIRSSDPHGKCFITTANLDGETNLKTLMVPRNLPYLAVSDLHKLGIIECESAKTDLYSFNGKIVLTTSDQKILPLTAENVLLRGSRVKNTECVIGCAVYTGMTTKLQLNSRSIRHKSATSEIYINRFLIFVLIVLVIIVTVLYFLKSYNELFVIPQYKYLGPAADSYSVRQFLQDYLSFLILFNYLIPISLYVTIEMCRVLGGLFMEWSLTLYDADTDQPCIVNTSNLNEDLGQINILFSDKTGTLTKNEMIFQQCSIKGHKYQYKKTRLLEEDCTHAIDLNQFNEDQKIFFQALSLCHTVQVAADLNRYDNQSVDENADENTPNTDSMNLIDKKMEFHSISDITEESYNSSRHSMEKAVETSLSSNPQGNSSTQTNSSDVNPLLNKNIGNLQNILEKRKRPYIVKRSPNFTRLTPVSMIVTNSNINRCTLSLSKRNTIDGRPISLQYNRSNSHLELDNCDSGRNSFGRNVKLYCHRRSQSYGTPVVYRNQTVSSSNVGGTIQRAASTASRESYAAPSFQRQPTLLIRNESQRRKCQIENAVQLLDYQASSADEKALVEACAHLGYIYMGDDDNILKLRILPPHMDYKRPLHQVEQIIDMNFHRLNILEFTSERKRMSVLVKDQYNVKWIFCKGAESYVLPLCNNTNRDMLYKTNAHISDFARLGLRTLAVARRKITDEEYEEFSKELQIAQNSLDKRQVLTAQCYAKIETNLELLGATAVEDSLQDEVADTLISLQKAGIKIWVLTGDKVETALNIALACGHIPPEALKYFIVDCDSKKSMLMHLNVLEREIIFGLGRQCALLIDGKSLTIALNETANEFRDVAIKCVAVLCCRLSPLQKSEIVALIKTSSNKFTTAAIGDGANDVSMIQEAQVGIGIIGKEGRQAALCADFALAKFSMLKHLLLVHGHYHTARLTLLVLYFFYKNIFFMGIMFLFQFHSLFSSASVYDSLFLTLYNVVYTSLPIFIISLTEKPFPEHDLTSKPELYLRNINNKQLHWPYFSAWIIQAIYHVLICFYFTVQMFTTNNALLTNGQTVEFSCFGTLLMQLVVIVSNLKLMLNSKYLSYLYIITIIGSIMSFVLTTFIYNIIDIRYDTDIYGAYNKLLSSLSLWFFFILATVACLLPDFTYRMATSGLNLPKRKFFPGRERLRLIRENHKMEITHF